MIDLADLHLTERNGVWLTCDEDHSIWLYLEEVSEDPEKVVSWLEIDIRVDNYPGLTVNTVQLSSVNLARHIRRYCAGFHVRKLNIAVRYAEIVTRDGLVREIEEE